MNELTRHAAILELSGIVGKRELRSAYRVQMNRWHPDRHRSDPAKERIAHDRSVAINVAHDFLESLLQHTDRLVVSGAPPSASRARSRPPPETRRPSRPRSSAGFRDENVVEVHVRSSNIYSIGYDRRRQILYVKFYRSERLGTDVYRYFDVPETLFQEFMAAESKGRFAHRNIYGRFRFERC